MIPAERQVYAVVTDEFHICAASDWRAEFASSDRTRTFPVNDHRRTAGVQLLVCKQGFDLDVDIKARHGDDPP